METTFTINGKKYKLVEVEEEKAEKKDDLFRKPEEGDNYYVIRGNGRIDSLPWSDDGFDNDVYKNANCCLDKGPMERRALEETLSRLLWRFSMQNGGDEIDWNAVRQEKWYIYYIYDKKKFDIGSNFRYRSMTTCYFSSRGLAQRAIDEIIVPFCKEHPELGYEVAE